MNLPEDRVITIAFVREFLGLPVWMVAHQLGIGEPLLLGKDLIITPAHQARIVLGTVERFCFSGDERIGGAHVPPVNGVDPASFAELTWRIVPWAERAWHDIRSPGGSLPFRHDHYLKLWQLTRPRIGADYLMFDEAQDANPVIVSSSKASPILRRSRSATHARPSTDGAARSTLSPPGPRRCACSCLTLSGSAPPSHTRRTSG